MAFEKGAGLTEKERSILLVGGAGLCKPRWAGSARDTSRLSPSLNAWRNAGIDGVDPQAGTQARGTGPASLLVTSVWG